MRGKLAVDASMEFPADIRSQPTYKAFMNTHHRRLCRPNSNSVCYRPPLWQVIAFSFSTTDIIIGAELGDSLVLENMDLMNIPASMWAVFPIRITPLTDRIGETYAKIEMEWFAKNHRYTRDQNVPHLEVYPLDGTSLHGKAREIWMPILMKEGMY